MGVESSILSRWYIRMPIKLSRWCFQIKYGCIFTRKIGEDEPFWTSIFFQRGWNHQLELEYVPVGEFTKHQIQDNGNQPLLSVQEEKQNPDRNKNLSNPAPQKKLCAKKTDFETHSPSNHPTLFFPNKKKTKDGLLPHLQPKSLHRVSWGQGPPICPSACGRPSWGPGAPRCPRCRVHVARGAPWPTWRRKRNYQGWHTTVVHILPGRLARK